MPKPGALACGLVLIFAAANALPSTHTHHDAVHDALLELEKDVSAMDSLPAQHGANFERRREACERRVSENDGLLQACHKCLRWGWWNRCSFHPATQRCESTSASTASIFAGGEYLVASKDDGLTAAQVPLQKCSWLKVAVVFDWDHTIASAHMYNELQDQAMKKDDGDELVWLPEPASLPKDMPNPPRRKYPKDMSNMKEVDIDRFVREQQIFVDQFNEEHLTAYLNQHYPGIHFLEDFDPEDFDRAMKRKVDEDFIEMWGKEDRGARLLALHEMLHNLRSGDIRPHLYILSDGIESEIERALEILGLRAYFREVVGKYEDRLKYLDRITSIRRHGKTKNDFLQHLVTQGYGRILFVDDSQSNIDKAQRAGVSTLEVTGVGTGADHHPCSFPTPKVCARHGLDPKDMMEKYAEFLASVVPVHLWTTAEPVGPGHLYTIYE